MTLTGQMITLENEYLKIAVNSLGAELCSCVNKKLNHELIWEANPQFWPKHSPILFPFIGKLYQENYTVNKVKYSMPKHGFVKTMQWELIAQQKELLTFKVTHNQETLKIYPYAFELLVHYQLAKDCLICTFDVINPSDQCLYFALGAHPAFNIPFIKNTLFDEYEVDFEQLENVTLIDLSKDGFITNERTPWLSNTSKYTIKDADFKRDTLLTSDLKSTGITITHPKHAQQLIFKWENFPILALWKPLNAPFLCIEPWAGLPDEVDGKTEIMAKKHIQNIPALSSKSFAWSIQLC